jgi:predicted transcriptional regulator
MKKSFSRFTEESYNKKKEASHVMRQAGMSVNEICEILNVSDSSYYLMEKHDWEGYQEYLRVRREKEQVRVAEANNIQPEIKLVPEPGQLDRIEAKLDLLLDKKGFTLLRR